MKIKANELVLKKIKYSNLEVLLNVLSHCYTTSFRTSKMIITKIMLFNH